jgi:hypothetical protein
MVQFKTQNLEGAKVVALEEVYRTIKSGLEELSCRTESTMKHEIYELF